MLPADLRPSDAVLDLFCGTGTISLLLAGRCRSVTGVESSAAAVADAKRNAALNAISNASFWLADLSSFQAAGTVFAQMQAVDVVVAGELTSWQFVRQHICHLAGKVQAWAMQGCRLQSSG